MVVGGSCHLTGFNVGSKLAREGREAFCVCGGKKNKNRRQCQASPSKQGSDMNVSLQNITPEPSQRRLWQSVNKETKGRKCLIVLEKDVSQFFNIFCPDAQRYCSRVGGAGRRVRRGVLSVPGDGALLSRH